MKRIQLFEFEDLSWFPNGIRICMTRYIVTIHKILGTAPILADLVKKALHKNPSNQIVDLCSGSGGPMPDVLDIITSEENYKDTHLILTDLYPNGKAASKINQKVDDRIRYRTEPLDASNVGEDLPGLRTMICSMHHMPPRIAKGILKDAKDSGQPICIYEISDNSFPKWLWWIAIPTNIIMVLLLTPFIRPMSFNQLIFTYIIPILPLAIAWDGAVSNARTYTLEDMDILLEGLEGPDYTWEKKTIKGKGGRKLYLMGIPA